MDKAMTKIINRIADQLPVIMQHCSELHHVLGEDLIAQGETKLTNGETILATKKYTQYMPVMIAMNHRRRLRKAYEENGGDGIAAYISNINKMMETQAKRIPLVERKDFITSIKNFLWKILKIRTSRKSPKLIKSL